MATTSNGPESSFRSSLNLNRSQAVQTAGHPKSSATMMRYLTVPDAELFRAEAATAIRTLVEKLEKIQLVSFLPFID